MIVVGIDPGITGACAIWWRDGLSDVFDLPVSGGHVDPAILADKLEDAIGLRRNEAWFIIELQGLHPNTAAHIASKTMRGYGRIEGVLAALDMPVHAVTPGKWKRLTGTPKHKDGARARASQLMPDGARFWPLVKHHGRAEAALLAYYGAVILAPTPQTTEAA
jgi:crossover junction endodeoxyribonuclease RuvC